MTAVVVLPNQQVEQGDPLLRIKSTESSHLLPDPFRGSDDTDVDLAALVVLNEAPPPDVFDDLTAYLLGFDLDPAAAKALRTAYRRRVEGSDPADHDLLAREDAFLDLFADIGSLYRPRTEAEVGDQDIADQTSTQEFVIESSGGSTPTGAACRRGSGSGSNECSRGTASRARRTGPCWNGRRSGCSVPSPGSPSWPTSSPRCWGAGWTSLVSC